MKADKKIETLLQDFDFVNPGLSKIIRFIRNTVFYIAPSSQEKVMYGGIIFTMPDRMFCGLFLRKNHVSVEFDLGYLLNDTGKLLEGSGKYRRHLKIHDKNEIKTKRVEYFISESFDLIP